MTFLDDNGWISNDESDQQTIYLELLEEKQRSARLADQLNILATSVNSVLDGLREAGVFPLKTGS